MYMCSDMYVRLLFLIVCAKLSSSYKVSGSPTWRSSNCSMLKLPGRDINPLYKVRCFGMSVIPTGTLPPVEIMDLSGNSLTQIESRSFQFCCASVSYTTWLSFANNFLTKVGNGSFDCFVSLKNLSLQLNSLVQLEAGTFHGLYGLETLLLKSNLFKEIPYESLKRLDNLETLDLSGNSFRSFAFGDYFSQKNKPRSLKKLYLADMDDLNIHKSPESCCGGSCRTYYEVLDFRQLYNVKMDTELFRCYHIDNLYFSDFPMLYEPSILDALRCSHVNNLHVNMGGEQAKQRHIHLTDASFKGLTYQSCNETIVRRIGLNFAQVTEVRKFVFSNIKGLEYIDLSKNQIHRVDPEAFANVDNLRGINISHNNLQSVPMIKYTYNVTLIEYIDLSWNKIFQDKISIGIAPKRFKSIYSQTKSVVLAGSWFTYAFADYGVSALESLNISHCKIGWFDLGHMSQLSALRLRVMDVSYNNLLEIPIDWLKYLHHLEYFDFSGNHVVYNDEVNNAFKHHVNLTCIKFNQVLNIEQGLNTGIMFSGLMVKQLYFIRSNIRSISSSAFTGSVHLRLLDVSYNKITGLEKNIFQTNHLLEELNLRGNQIRVLDPPNTFSSLVNLRSLDIENNRFLCNCDIIPLQQWIIDNLYLTVGRSRILLRNVTCFLHSSRSYVDIIEWDSEALCWKKATKIVGIVLGCLLLSTACAVFGFSVRFQALFWYEMIKSKLSYHKALPRNRSDVYEYQAYLSCVPDSVDEAWVVRQLLCAIENPPYELTPMKLCFPSRDFKPGCPKMVSAANNLRLSKHALVILSKDYVANSWTRFELSMVSEMWRNSERSAESLIVVYLKRHGESLVGVERLPVLGVRRNAWLVWPTDVADRPSFWMKLRRSLAK
uniref:TIR domain-containing protein n=2 Tax=Ciona intestinalis TaxID=7719 RepID=H2XZF2_CIOIN